MGLKHGMKLATISGVNGVYTSEDIAKVRELALAAREEHANAGKARPKKTAKRRATTKSSTKARRPKSPSATAS